MNSRLPPSPFANDFPIDPETWSRVTERLGLSTQQTRMVECLMCGMRDKQIARALSLSIPTVRTYFGRIFPRLGVQDRIELILRVFVIAHEEGWGRSR